MSSTSSRSYNNAQKPAIIYSREPSTDSRGSYSSTSATYHSSSRSSMSSSSQSEAYHHPDRIYTFRAPDSDNYHGTYKYSSSNKIKVINHNAPAVREAEPHSARATHEDYKRTQQRSEKRHT